MYHSLKFLVVFATVVFSTVNGEDATGFPMPCNSTIYCQGDLLKTIQLSQIYNESKTFVDMGMLNSPGEILESFARLNFTGDVRNNSEHLQQLNDFVSANFAMGNEFENFTFVDWAENPDFLRGISDTNLREWASKLHEIWNQLGRKIKEEVKDSDRNSIIYSPNPVVVPGGRFREFYYWDSYWIQRGLLVSEMPQTVRGMIDNFLENVRDLGYGPNGGRIYYERSQPPLLIPMVDAYFEHTQDLEYLRENFDLMDQEFRWWMAERTVIVEKNGINFTMARYAVDRQGPRPEAMAKEFNIIDPLPYDDDVKSLIYSHLKSACESGWDFSTRWFKKEDWETGDVGFEHTKTRDIIPVDLNAFLYWNAELLTKFCTLLGNQSFCSYYEIMAYQFREGIEQILWDDEDGTWYDYDWQRDELRKEFYPSNIAPLWVHAHSTGQIEPTLRYLTSSGALSYPAGIPTSFIDSDQQWDFPNAWPPLVHMIVEGLATSGDQIAGELAFNIAKNWTDANYIGWVKFDAMFEKYDVTKPGCRGSGGYYETVLGFGWTNGVILDFLQKYGDRLIAPFIPIDLDCPKITYDIW